MLKLILFSVGPFSLHGVPYINSMIFDIGCKHDVLLPASWYNAYFDTYMRKLMNSLYILISCGWCLLIKCNAVHHIPNNGRWGFLISLNIPTSFCPFLIGNIISFRFIFLFIYFFNLWLIRLFVIFFFFFGIIFYCFLFTKKMISI